MKQLLIGICLLIFPALGLCGEQISVIRVDGYGLTHNEAVQNGLIEALKQTKGVSIDARRSMSKKIRNHSLVTGAEATNLRTIDNRSLTRVKEATKGLIPEYKILDSGDDGSGGHLVKLAVTIRRYTTPGISPNSRRRIAVIPFDTAGTAYDFMGRQVSGRKVSRMFSQKLVTSLTQSRRFTVLDREYMNAYLSEKNLILSPDASLSEQIKLGEVLGADYILSGVISQAGIHRKTSRIQVSGETATDISGLFVADYRIIVVATRQIKWSDSVYVAMKMDPPDHGSDQDVLLENSLIGQSADRLVRGALDNIYPVRVARIQPNGTLIMNQGGKGMRPGMMMDIFHKGPDVIDVYSGESLGGSEDWVATIKVTRVTAKLSYGAVIEGSPQAVSQGDICRRVIRNRSPAIEKAGKKSSAVIMENGGVRLPYQ